MSWLKLLGESLHNTTHVHTCMYVCVRHFTNRLTDNKFIRAKFFYQYLFLFIIEILGNFIHYVLCVTVCQIG